MTRYLDREPVAGDRVHVEYMGTVSHLCTGDVYPVVHSDSGLVCRAPMSGTRVIAPEPQVGDVVTADMDLPEGTVLEEDGGAIAKLMSDGCWWRTTDESYSGWSLGDLLVGEAWRIVRIGGAS